MHEPFIRRLALSLAAALVTVAATAGVSSPTARRIRTGTVRPGPRAPFVVTRGTPGDDTLTGTAADDVMFGLGGSDTMNSGGTGPT